MNTELTKQYEHTWRIFARIVKDFDDDAWLHTGRAAITPARLAFHILQSVKYYLEDTSTILFDSGKPFDNPWATVEEADLPSQDDIVARIPDFNQKTSKWLSDMILDTENTAFPWAGETKLGVVIFLLRHTIFHIGELSSLLNESKNGDVEDHYVKAL